MFPQSQKVDMWTTQLTQNDRIMAIRCLEMGIAVYGSQCNAYEVEDYMFKHSSNNSDAYFNNLTNWLYYFEQQWINHQRQQQHIQNHNIRQDQNQMIPMQQQINMQQNITQDQMMQQQQYAPGGPAQAWGLPTPSLVTQPQICSIIPGPQPSHQGQQPSTAVIVSQQTQSNDNTSITPQKKEENDKEVIDLTEQEDSPAPITTPVSEGQQLTPEVTVIQQTQSSRVNTPINPAKKEESDKDKEDVSEEVIDLTDSPAPITPSVSEDDTEEISVEVILTIKKVVAETASIWSNNLQKEESLSPDSSSDEELFSGGKFPSWLTGTLSPRPQEEDKEEMSEDLMTPPMSPSLQMTAPEITDTQHNKAEVTEQQSQPSHIKSADNVADRTELHKEDILKTEMSKKPTGPPATKKTRLSTKRKYPDNLLYDIPKKRA